MFLGIVTLVGMFALSGVFPGNRALGSASVASPSVTSITQITHDGFRKTNLLADETQLYVTELPAAQRVIAKVSLPKSDRSLVPSPFANLQALAPMCEGKLLADVVAAIGSIDIVLGEIDR